MPKRCWSFVAERRRCAALDLVACARAPSGLVLGAAGGVAALGVFALLDALAVHALNDVRPALGGALIVPPALAFAGFVLMVATPVRVFVEDDANAFHAWAAGQAHCRVCSSFLAFFTALGVALVLVPASRATSASDYAYGDVPSPKPWLTSECRYLPANSSGYDDERGETMHVRVAEAAAAYVCALFVAAMLVLYARLANETAAAMEQAAEDAARAAAATNRANERRRRAGADDAGTGH